MTELRRLSRWSPNCGVRSATCGNNLRISGSSSSSRYRTPGAVGRTPLTAVVRAVRRWASVGVGLTWPPSIRGTEFLEAKHLAALHPAREPKAFDFIPRCAFESLSGRSAVVRIPVKAASESGSIRPGVPVHFGQRIRSISARALGCDGARVGSVSVVTRSACRLRGSRRVCEAILRLR